MRKMKSSWLPIAAILAALSANQPAWSDTPPGWFSSQNPSAYTLRQGGFEFSVNGMSVNDTIDFLNVRDDLLAGNRRLVGDSGDLNGRRLELHYGILDTLSIEYWRQDHDLAIDLGEVASAEIVDIDDQLDTSAQHLALKWNFYQGDLLNPNNRQSGASLELRAFQTSTDPFDVVIKQFEFSNLQLIFTNPQTFSVDRLEDEGWSAKVLYTWPLEGIGVGTIWGGYGESSATSGTTSDLTSQSIASLFEQAFELDETYLYLGGSLNISIMPRLPLSISYEYIRINDTDFSRIPLVPADFLPSFLTASAQGNETGNHTLKAQLSYWITPRVRLGVTGNLYSNQFLGVLPHYNNPLSGSFSSTPYGFAGVELGFKF